MQYRFRDRKSRTRATAMFRFCHRTATNRLSTADWSGYITGSENDDCTLSAEEVRDSMSQYSGMSPAIRITAKLEFVNDHLKYSGADSVSAPVQPAHLYHPEPSRLNLYTNPSVVYSTGSKSGACMYVMRHWQPVSLSTTICCESPR